MFEKTKHSRHCFETLDTKKKLNFLNSIRGKQNNLTTVHALQNLFKYLLTNEFEIWEFLYYFFLTLVIFKDKNAKRQNHKKTLANIPNSPVFSLLQKKIYDAVRELSSNKPLGPGTVPARAMKDGQTILVPHFTSILNACTKQNLFPDCIKKADLSPIYNTADPVYVTNYRPISITSAFSEYFERFLHQEITIHVQKFEHRNPLQVVFPKLVSTADALLFFYFS